jgi:5-formyltetrahydrofolate cyclo-ligase
MAVPSLKSDLRTSALERRREYARSLTPDLRTHLEKKLAAILLPHVLAARVVAFYHPLRDEISPYPLLGSLGARQRAALPWFLDRDSRMMFRAAPVVEVGPWKMLQPSHDSEALAPDLVLVPLVAADRSGARIGHGKGHYDRALTHLGEGGQVLTIGIGWEHQILEELIPTDPWDVPLNALATPGEWIDCR